MKIMVVDDEKSMLIIMKKMLAKIPGVEVIGTFQNTDEAYNFAKEHDAEISFLDIAMPIESGLELARRISLVNPNMDIVFLTSHKEYALDAFDVHAFDYLVKPVSQERLEQTIKRAMDKKSLVLAASDRIVNRKMFVYCLGSLDVRNSDGKLIRWTSAKCAELFAYLLLNRGRIVSSEVIMETVFRGMPHQNAETYLHTTVYQLRKTLEPHGLKYAVLSNGEGYGIDIRELYIDFIEFEEGIKQLYRIDDSNFEKAADLEKLYAGELFNDKDYLWAIYEREHLSEAYAGLVKRFGKYLMEVKSLSLAAIILKKLIEKNGLDEEANCLLMQAYAAQRDKVSLVSHYDKFSKLLKRELGVNPGNTVVNFYAGLRKSME